MSESQEVFTRIRAAEESATQKLWIPGQGEVDPRVTSAQRVVREYDERLELARHQLTGDWVIYVKLDRDWLFPVIGIGPELPANAEDLRARLRKADAAGKGEQFVKEINARNERILREKRAASDEAIGETAEALEWGFRREGMHPSPRIFVPRDL